MQPRMIPSAPAADQPPDHLAVGLPGLLGDDAEAQLVVDDPVDQRTVVGVGDDDREPVAGETVTQERLLHRVCRREQADPADRPPPHRGSSHVADVQQGDRDRSLDGRSHPVHRVGAEDEQLGPAGLEPGCGSREQHAGLVPPVLGLQALDLGEVDRVEQQPGGGEPAHTVRTSSLARR